MSGTATWLHGQRKTELVDLAEKVGLKDYESFKKAELESALDDHMRANQEQLSKDSSLSAFYKRVNSPVKRDSSGSTTLVETKPAKRRITKAKEDIEAEASNAIATVRDSTSQALAPKTPAKGLLPANVPLPPSPAEVASQIDRYTAKVSTRMNEVYKTSGISQYISNARDAVSSTRSIESIAVVIEVLGLLNQLLPKKTLFMVPAIDAIGMPEWPVKSNDLFMLLRSEFWSAFGVWFTTSLFLPLLSAYFFNLTLKAKHGEAKHNKHLHPAAQYDPLTFNLSKALIMWLVYGQGLAYCGVPSEVTKGRIESSVPGGYQGVLVATGIGVITSLYEAVLRK